MSLPRVQVDPYLDVVQVSATAAQTAANASQVSANAAQAAANAAQTAANVAAASVSYLASYLLFTSPAPVPLHNVLAAAQILAPQTQLALDWAALINNPVETALQIVGSATNPVTCYVADITTSNTPICSVIVSASSAALVVGGWTPFVKPAASTTYALYASAATTSTLTLFSARLQYRR